MKFNAPASVMTASSESGAAYSARLPNISGRGQRRVRNVHIGDFVEIKNSTVGEGHQRFAPDLCGRFRRGNTVISAAAWSLSITTARPSTATPSGIMLHRPPLRTCGAPERGMARTPRRAAPLSTTVPAGALGIARARQVNKPQWAKGKLKVHRKAAGKGRSRLEINFENRIRTE